MALSSQLSLTMVLLFKFFVFILCLLLLPFIPAGNFLGYLGERFFGRRYAAAV